MKMPIVRGLLVPSNLHRFDQVRTLICDGPALLAWVGGFRTRPFSGAGVAALAELAPALRARLRLERQLVEARLDWQGLTLAVNSLPAPAYLLADRRIEHANPTGLLLLQRDRRAIESLLSGPLSDRISRNVIAVNGVTCLSLCVIHEPSADLDVRLARKCAIWSLTCAESAVVASLVLGDANKTVAAKVGRTEATIEFHVTRILKKAGVSARAELVAAFWTDP
jgi:DNA-binding NarL/FixJ family response regulator